MEHYFGKCGSCAYLNLDDKSYGKYYCMERRIYLVATESIDGCRYYQIGHTDREVEDAREGRR